VSGRWPCASVRKGNADGGFACMTLPGAALALPPPQPPTRPFVDPTPASITRSTALLMIQGASGLTGEGAAFARRCHQPVPDYSVSIDCATPTCSRECNNIYAARCLGEVGPRDKMASSSGSGARYPHVGMLGGQHW
jgi:hypothetical protein